MFESRASVRRPAGPPGGDALHPETNRAQMAGGTPLDDEDRWPWLRRIADWIGARETSGQGAVITCSALKRRYRDLLREGHPSVRFVHLAADPALITERITGRTGHYMPPSLLRSQLDALEPLADDEPGVRVETLGDPAGVADRALALLEARERAERPAR